MLHILALLKTKKLISEMHSTVQEDAFEEVRKYLLIAYVLHK